ncbi:YkgJ family cysteine cluster protein [Candidatus Woesearchaeota archaeon]|nr:YkgJ family cysteine cluster protein [Candidatus Woesearchaeota archaeon]
MKCNHCGLCCRDPLTQINLTVGDIWRISDFLKIDVEELFKENIGMNPFREPEYEDIYDIDLGLNLPCKFRVNDRCAIYPARPLNCRLFPQWVLGNIPNIKEVITDHKCDYNISRKKDYKKYSGKVGNILIEESKFYRLFKKINIKGLFEIKGKDIRETEYNTVQELRKMFKDHLKIDEIKKAIDENLDKIKENKKRLEETE